MAAKTFLRSLIGLVLIVSIILNVFLLDKTLSYYKIINLLRLDPIETKFFNDQSNDAAFEKNVHLIVLFGDSRIANWRPKLDVPGSIVLNKGIRGQTTAQLKLRLVKDVLSYSPDLVILQAGINDLKNIGLFPDKKDKIISQCKGNLYEIAERISAEQIPVIILTILPTGKPSFFRSWLWSEEINKAISKVNNSLKELKDEKVYILDADTILIQERYIRPELKQDLLHLNNKGYEQLNYLLQPFLHELISYKTH